jgi:predicted helicase
VSVDTLLASLDLRGRDFERLCTWLLENAPEYRSQLKGVWLWDDWPGRWGRDAGIDLVAEDHEGVGSGRRLPRPVRDRLATLTLVR